MPTFDQLVHQGPPENSCQVNGCKGMDAQVGR